MVAHALPQMLATWAKLLVRHKRLLHHAALATSYQRLQFFFDFFGFWWMVGEYFLPSDQRFALDQHLSPIHPVGHALLHNKATAIACMKMGPFGQHTQKTFFCSSRTGWICGLPHASRLENQQTIANAQLACLLKLRHLRCSLAHLKGKNPCLLSMAPYPETAQFGGSKHVSKNCGRSGLPIAIPIYIILHPSIQV